MRRAALALAALVTVTGCSSIIEGTSQELVINTNPSGADCGLYREGLRIASVTNTPGSATVKKTKHDIWIVCVKPGYQMATFFNHSGVAGATVGNVILGGGVGWIIDSASGSDNKYDSPVNISLVPDPRGPATATALPGTFAGQKSAP
jgi:hypothetical protein